MMSYLFLCQETCQDVCQDIKTFKRNVQMFLRLLMHSAEINKNFDFQSLEARIQL